MKKNTIIKPLDEFVTIENDLRNSIREACTKYNVSQYKLGKMAGIHPIQIGWFMKGEKTLALPTVAKLANAVKTLEKERIDSEVKKHEKPLK